MYLESQLLRITIPCILWRHDCGIGHIVSFRSVDCGGYFPPLILMYTAHSDFLRIEQSCINNHQCDCLWGRISSYVEKKFNVTVLKLSLLLLHVISYRHINRPSVATVLDTHTFKVLSNVQNLECPLCYVHLSGHVRSLTDTQILVLRYRVVFKNVCSLEKQQLGFM